MDYTAFSHGQIVSKQWLVDNIEEYLYKDIRIIILGGWYNILGLMLLTKYHNTIKSIINLDIDCNAITIADKICEAYVMENVIKNVCANANTLNDFKYDLVINCSPEHMDSDDWFTLVKPNKLIVLQSSDVTIKELPWYCINPNPTLDYFIKHYPLKQNLYSNTKEIVYTNFSYNRFMLIGVT